MSNSAALDRQMTDSISPQDDRLFNLPAPDLARDRILAAIDVGTNSIHMVIVRVQPALPSFTIIDREKATVRLGDRDRETGNLTPEAMERAMNALRRCQEIARSHGAEDIIAVATSATREAPNGREFIKDVERQLGLRIDLISGQEEARRIYLGVLSGMEFNDQPHVMIDIGGGSTELILGDGREPRTLSSTKVGAVRLTAEMISTDPISSDDFNYLQAYIRGMLERATEELQSQVAEGETLRMVGTSGTIETLATLHARDKQGTAPTPLNGYFMSLKDLREIVNRLRKLNYAERAALPGMSERRSEIIVAGALILQEAMMMLNVDGISICERSLREGLVVDWMITHGLIEDRLRFQGSIRQRSVIKIAHKYHVNLAHSKHVADLAISLFHQTRPLLHDWSDNDAELLWAAAILHNCGHFISHAAHHKHSYYLIRNGELFGYTELELETIANLARYHRKSPPKKKHPNYRSIGSKRYRKLVDQLSAILRLAVALDRRQLGAVREVQCEFNADMGELHLELTPADSKENCTLELWSLNYKKDVFESEFGVTVIPHLRSLQVQEA
jgi:exopolyphosphatase/guanosine-5'-triphosphate,3'-diphosphate pyrophosphatase